MCAATPRTRGVGAGVGWSDVMVAGCMACVPLVSRLLRQPLCDTMWAALCSCHIDPRSATLINLLQSAAGVVLLLD
jgi:hypothetical protein